MKIAIIHNCQGPGVASVFRAYLPHDEVRFVSIGAVADDAGFAPGDFDFCYASNPAATRLKTTFPDLEKQTSLRPLPGIAFDAFHPDFCYVRPGGRLLQTLGQPEQSIIALASWLTGRSVAEALGLFTAEFMRQAGYLAHYAGEKQRLVSEFAAHGLDLAARLPVWVRKGPFMYTFNHPRIDVLHDIALACLLRDGLVPRDTANAGRVPDRQLYDNLAKRAALPIYPPIAERFGARGSFRLRVDDSGYWGLRDFVEASYAAFEAAGAGAADVTAGRHRFEPVLELVRAA